MSKESAVPVPSVSIIESSSKSNTEVELTLSIFQELSITAPRSKQLKLEKESSEMNQKSRQLEAFSSLMNTLKRNHSRHCDVVSQRFLPYNVAAVMRRTKSTQLARKRRIIQEESEVTSFSRIKLEGCDFQGSLPSVSCNERKLASGEGRPCWLQYRGERQNQFYFGSTCETSPALQSESDFEVDELSEYFEAFVTVKMKMSSQAESMYA